MASLGGLNNQYSQTLGVRSVYENDKWIASIALYYQMGKTGTIPTQDIAASDIMLDVWYRLNSKLSLGAGYERLSGNDEVNPNNENNAFTPLYASNHKFNGLMDYFYVGNHRNSVGLQDVFGKVTFKSGNHTFGAHLHYFLTAADLAATNGTVADPALGTELDLLWKYNHNDVVGFAAGYSQLFATNSMELLKGGSRAETQNWMWVMVTVKPVFIKEKKQ